MKLNPRHLILDLTDPDKAWDENPAVHALLRAGWTVASSATVEDQKKKGQASLLILFAPPRVHELSVTTHRALFFAVGTAAGLAAAALGLAL